MNAMDVLLSRNASDYLLSPTQGIIGLVGARPDLPKIAPSMREM